MEIVHCNQTVCSPLNCAPIKDSVLISANGLWTPSSELREYLTITITIVMFCRALLLTRNSF